MKKTSLTLALAALAMAAFLTGCNTDSDSGSTPAANGGQTVNPATNTIDAVKVTGKTFTGSSDYTIWGYEGVFTAARNITVSDFYMGKYEVTKDQYKAVMSDTTLNTLGITADPSYSTNKPATYVIASGETDGKRPVENVSWYDAVYFCNCLSKKDGLTPAYTITGETVSKGTLSYAGTDGKQTVTVKYISSATVAFVDGANGWRLPTEVEWEFAARGGNPSTEADAAWNYEYSGVDSSYDSVSAMYSANSNKYCDSALDSVGWYRYNICNNGTTSTTAPTTGTAGDVTHEVGKKDANALGLCDMSGNVWEWCYDWYASLISDSTPLAGPSSGSGRVLCGGSWNYDANYACVAYRYYLVPGNRLDNLGFRVVRNAQ